MQSYTDLIKALRSASTVSTAWEKLMLDAAAAIEDLQAEVDKANKSADAYRAMYFTKRGDITIEKVRELDEIDCHFHSALIRLMYRRINELEAQLPKRGEWIHVEGDEPGEWRCTACRKIAEGHGEFRFCPNCGAKMREVQE